MNPVRLLAALASGLLFGVGLALSGMINPAKVLGFLDIAGAWDPSLAAVMAGAIPTTMLLYRLGLRRDPTRCAAALAPPPIIDRPLVIGAVVFGVGWGLVGFCPGPALAALALDSRSLIFVAAMAVGMWVHSLKKPAL